MSFAPDDTQPTNPFRPRPERQTPRAWRVVLFLAAVAQFGLIVLGGAALVASLTDSEVPPTVSVIVSIDGESATRTTQAATVGDLLGEAGINLKDEDSLSVPESSLLTEGMVIEIRRARTITLTIDGEIRPFTTSFDNPLDILKNAGVTADADDLIFVDGTKTTVDKLVLWPVPVSSINVEHALTVTLNDDGTPFTFTTTADTVGDALFQAGVTLYLGDVVSPDLDAPITDKLTVSLERSHPVTIIADGVSIETRTRGVTVSSTLAESGIALMGLDYAIPAEDTTVIPGMAIRVIRVREDIISEQKTLPFETVYQADAALELDQRAILQEGQTGIEESRYRIRYENDIEIGREFETAVITRAPVNRLIAYGTQIVLRTVDTPDGPREYWRKFRMIATSYHPAALGGDNITATGRILTKGIVGIDPIIISYGTLLYVPGYGEGIAADTGGPRSTRYWIDLGYDDDNYVSWSRNVDVYLLTPVPEKINYLLPQP